jgi:hypothetical protein
MNDSVGFTPPLKTMLVDLRFRQQNLKSRCKSTAFFFSIQVTWVGYLTGYHLHNSKFGCFGPDTTQANSVSHSHSNVLHMPNGSPHSMTAPDADSNVVGAIIHQYAAPRLLTAFQRIELHSIHSSHINRDCGVHFLKPWTVDTVPSVT